MLDVPNDEYLLYVLPDDFALHFETVNFSGTLLEINPIVKEPNSLTLFVTDYSTRTVVPVENAFIKYIQNGILVLSSKTDSEGKLEILQLAEGQYEILVYKPDPVLGKIQTRAVINVPQPHSTTFQFPFTNGTIIVNAVDKVTQRPISNFSVKVFLESGYEMRDSIQSAANEQVFSSLPSAAYVVKVNAPGYTTFSKVVQVPEQELRVIAELVVQ